MTDELAGAVRFPVVANMLIPPMGYAIVGLGVVVLFAGAAIYVALSRRDGGVAGSGGSVFNRSESTRELLDDQNVATIANGGSVST
jgi:hypothetical protein